jgi:hypothetical protein
MMVFKKLFADYLIDVKRMIANVESLAQDNQYHKMYDWLRPPDTSTNFNNAKEKRHEGTGSWFLESGPFKEWKSGTRRYLWLHGIPGCGKTILCSTIIEHLRQNQDNFSQIILDFFFDFKHTEKQTVDKLLRSLVAQLYRRSENSRAELNNLYSSCQSGCQQPSTDSLFQSFQGMIDSVDKVQIVIDALDECKTRKELLLRLEKFRSPGHTNIYLLVTSRKEEELESEFRSWLYEENWVSIQQSRVGSDIREYIRGTLRADKGFQRWQSQQSVLEEIETKLMKKAGGM